MQKVKDFFLDAFDYLADLFDDFKDWVKVLWVRFKEFLKSPKMEDLTYKAQKGFVKMVSSFFKAIGRFIRGY